MLILLKVYSEVHIQSDNLAQMAQGLGLLSVVRTC